MSILIQTRMYLIIRRHIEDHRHSLALAVLALLISTAGPVTAQIQGGAQGSGSRAVHLPLSGRQQGGVSVQQAASPGSESSVNTLSNQIQIQGAYSGSVPAPDVPAGAITLTMADAIRMGLATNLGRIGSDTAASMANAERLQARSSLLPNLSASISENAAKIDLAAEGFSNSAFGLSTAFSFPTVVGPFHYYDVHGSLQQSVLDLTALHNLRSQDDSAAAAGRNARQAREEVVLAVTAVYLRVLASQALIAAQQSEVQYAERSYQQAKAQADAGNKAPIDANRSLVELQTEQQRLRSQSGEMEKQKNELARLIGIPLGRRIDLAETLESLPPVILSPEEAVRRAWSQRQDLKSATAQLAAAEEARKAAASERLPSVSVNGQYGLQGVNPDEGSNVFQASASLSVPIFTGGRIRADIQQANAVVEQRRAELADQRGAVELDVRDAFIDLDVANQEVTTAESNRKLALATLQQSQDRFAVGVADSVEVVNSQESLATANHDYVNSLFSQYVARISLAHAMGEAEKDVTDLFKRN